MRHEGAPKLTITRLKPRAHKSTRLKKRLKQDWPNLLRRHWKHFTNAKKRPPFSWQPLLSFHNSSQSENTLGEQRPTRLLVFTKTVLLITMSRWTFETCQPMDMKTCQIAKESSKSPARIAAKPITCNKTTKNCPKGNETCLCGIWSDLAKALMFPRANFRSTEHVCQQFVYLTEQDAEHFTK